MSSEKSIRVNTLSCKTLVGTTSKSLNSQIKCTSALTMYGSQSAYKIWTGKWSHETLCCPTAWSLTPTVPSGAAHWPSVERWGCNRQLPTVNLMSRPWHLGEVYWTCTLCHAWLDFHLSTWGETASIMPLVNTAECWWCMLGFHDTN